MKLHGRCALMARSSSLGASVAETTGTTVSLQCRELVSWWLAGIRGVLVVRRDGGLGKLLVSTRWRREWQRRPRWRGLPLKSCIRATGIPLARRTSHLFLQQGERASSIEGRWTLHKHNRTDIITQSVDETNCVIHGICGMLISNELIHQFRESLNIISDGSSLANMVKLPNQGFLLIPAKTLKQHRKEFRPTGLLKTFGHRLRPTRGRAIKLIQR